MTTTAMNDHDNDDNDGDCEHDDDNDGNNNDDDGDNDNDDDGGDNDDGDEDGDDDGDDVDSNEALCECVSVRLHVYPCLLSPLICKGPDIYLPRNLSRKQINLRAQSGVSRRSC
jgi:hypothetical protein